MPIPNQADVKNLLPENDYQSPYLDNSEFEEMLYARHVELETIEDLKLQRGTPIPALFNQFYKFVQNPSSVSVETFKRMVDTDETTGACADFLTTCLSARLGRYQHPNKEIASAVNKALNAVDGGFIPTLKEFYSAAWAGVFVGEKVFEDVPGIGFIPKKIAPMPPSTLLFETERTGEVTYDGILQYQRNYNPYLLGRGVGYFGGSVTTGLGYAQSNNARPDVFAKLGDLPFPLRTANSFNYLCIRIPKAKCIHYAFDAQGKFQNPYGRSLLRRVYKYYVMKDAILQMLAVALDRKGTPLLVVYYDPNQPLFDPAKIGAKNMAEARNNPAAAIHPADAAKGAMRNIHNDSVVYLPGMPGSQFKIDPVVQNSNAQDFIAAKEMCDKAIIRGMMIPFLLMNDGQGGFTAADVHDKTFERVLDGMNASAEEVLLKQWVRDILVLNFPEEMWAKDGLGSFGKREMGQEEMAKMMEMFEKGINNGIIDQQDLNDLNKMRDTINFDEVQKPIESPMMSMQSEDGENEAPGEQGDTPEEKKLIARVTDKVLRFLRMRR